MGQLTGQLRLMDDSVGRKPFVLDKEKSHARIEITPVRRGKELTFKYYVSVEIRPYPNPMMIGGMYASGTAKSEAELNTVIKDVHRVTDRFVEYGLQLEEIRYEEKE